MFFVHKSSLPPYMHAWSGSTLFIDEPLAALANTTSTEDNMGIVPTKSQQILEDANHPRGQLLHMISHDFHIVYTFHKNEPPNC